MRYAFALAAVLVGSPAMADENPLPQYDVGKGCSTSSQPAIVKDCVEQEQIVYDHLIGSYSNPDSYIYSWSDLPSDAKDKCVKRVKEQAESTETVARRRYEFLQSCLIQEVSKIESERSNGNVPRFHR